MAPVRVDRGRRLRSAGPAVVLALGFAVTSWAVAALAGGWGLPHNDDWSPIRIAEHLASTGQFRLLGWNRTALAGQSYPGAALLRLTGGGVRTLQALDLVASALALAVAYLLLRRFLPPAEAALGAATLLGTPEMWLLSTSVMTDALATALVLATLLLGVIALRAPDRRAAAAPLLGALLLGLWATTVREAALAAPVAVLLAAVRSRRPSLRALAWPAAAVLGVVVLAFEWWRRSLPGNDEPRVAVDLPATGGHVLEALAWTALVLSPITLFLLARWRRPRTWGAIAVAGGLALLLDAGLHEPLFPANYLSRRGAYQSAGLGTRAALVPEAVWLLVGAVAVVSAGVLLAWLADRPASPDPVLTGFVALTVGGLVVEDLLGQTTYSRYLLALPPVLAVFLLRTAPPPTAARARAAPTVLLGALCALAVVLSIGTLRSDAARWRVAQSLVDQGVAPMSIAVGQEWAGWHSGVIAVHARRDSPGDLAWWTGMFSDASECWLVAMDAGERTGYRLVRSASGVFVFRAVGAC